MATKTKSAGKPRSTSKRSTGSAPRSRSSAAAPKPLQREITAGVCGCLALFCVIGYFQVDAVFVDFFCKFVKGLIGYGYWLFPPALAVTAWILATHRGRPVMGRCICAMLLPVFFGALAHVIISREVLDTGVARLLFGQLYRSGTEMRTGGLFAGLLGLGLTRLFSVYGAVPVLLVGIAAAICKCFQISPSDVWAALQERRELAQEAYSAAQEVYANQAEAARVSRARRRAEKLEADLASDDDLPPLPPVHSSRRRHNAPLDSQPAGAMRGHLESAPAADSESVFGNPSDDLSFLSEQDNVPWDQPVQNNINNNINNLEADPVQASLFDEPQPDQIYPPPTRAAQTEKAPEKPEKKTRKKGAVDSEELQAATDAVSRSIAENQMMPPVEYHYPPLELLHVSERSNLDVREEMARNRERLQMTIDSFGVNAVVVDITRGPSVTRYDLELETGVKLAKLTNLDKDLALALGVEHVRIAPIPDKIATVGIEVPNKVVSTVYLRDIIGSEAFQTAGSKITFALGEDIGGSSICGNIAKLPHLLIAGTTGSGKSVCMNSLILSLLYKATPEEVRLIMIDPKMVELGIYNGIPHLYIPVVTDPKKAAGALQWAVIEMLSRYRAFSETGVRELSAYNRLRRGDNQPIVPQVVIVIDELADLMMVASKEVEDSICRVAQMGRAAGMHLVIATQRPSADVITGLMKANIPSRIAFAVSSAIDSRIILDQQGAEKLIGKGDMLYAPIGGGKPKRIQGTWVTDEEREDVVNYIKEHSTAQYDESIMKAVDEHTLPDKSEKGEGKKAPRAESVNDSAEASDNQDELLPQAAEVIFETKQASVSMLQRRLKLGYSRAARIVDQLEKLGVVGPSVGAKPREIRMTREEWLARSGNAPGAMTGGVQTVIDDYSNANPGQWADEN